MFLRRAYCLNSFAVYGFKVITIPLLKIVAKVFALSFKIIIKYACLGGSSITFNKAFFAAGLIKSLFLKTYAIGLLCLYAIEIILRTSSTLMPQSTKVALHLVAIHFAISSQPIALSPTTIVNLAIFI